jgi:hypothetical protein
MTVAWCWGEMGHCGGSLGLVEVGKAKRKCEEFGRGRTGRVVARRSLASYSRLPVSISNHTASALNGRLRSTASTESMYS